MTSNNLFVTGSVVYETFVLKFKKDLHKQQLWSYLYLLRHI